MDDSIFVNSEPGEIGKEMCYEIVKSGLSLFP